MRSVLHHLDRLLRNEWPTTLGGGDKGVAAPGWGLVLLLIVLAAFYGACMGAFSVLTQGGADWRQVLASAMKVPTLFSLTLLITLPSLYTFNALLGTRLTLVPVVHLMLGALGVTIAVLASIGPIVAFFSVSSTSYSFIVVLNVVVFAISGGLGLRFLSHVLRQSAPLPVMTTGPAEGEEAVVIDIHARRPRVGRILWIWMLVFGLVGMQLAWLLRPFIGTPDRPFAWFRPRSGNFFESVYLHLQRLIGAG